MKDRPSVFRMAFAGGAATVVYLVTACGVANAQNISTPTESAARPPASSAVQALALPYSVGEVVKMYQGGIDKDVIVNYVNSTASPFHLNADEIIYLRTLGMPQEITKAMIVHDGQLQQQRQVNQQYNQPPPPPGTVQSPYYGNTAAQSPVQVMAPTTPAPAVGDYGNYGYGYPYYPYYPYSYYGAPYYGYSGPLVIGGGWGWGRGWGYRGFRGGVGGFHGHVGVGGFHGGGFGGGFHGGGGGFHGGGGFGGGHGGGGGHR